MEVTTQILGRFHPLLVHLPIGILLLAFLFECLSYFDKYKKLKVAVRPALILGAFFAVLSCITGFFLKQEGGYPDRIVNLHQYLGFSTAVFAILLSFFRKRLKDIVPDSRKRKQARVFLFFLLIVLLSLTGHLGGSLTHGEEYLFASASLSPDQLNPIEKVRSIADVDSAVLYTEVIQPILEARCYSCHSAQKQKGQLRLDRPDLVQHGGKHGPILISGLPDSSEVYKRIMLPLEDEHHMPPHERTQLSSTEITLIQLWIEEGASFSKSVLSLGNSGKVKKYIKFYQTSSPTESWIPEKEIKEADSRVLEKLRSAGVEIVPISTASNYLMVSFVNSRTITEEMLQLLLDIKNHIVWLNLGNTSISNDQLTIIAQFQNLYTLYLNNTAITDTGLTEIEKLNSLRYLNLVNTNVTDQALPSIASLKNLKQLYVYQTNITSQGIANLIRELKTVVIDTGNYKIPSMPGDTIVYKRKT